MEGSFLATRGFDAQSGPTRILEFLVPLLVLCAAMVGLGSYLIIHSILRIHHYDRMIKELKRQHSAIAEFID